MTDKTVTPDPDQRLRLVQEEDETVGFWLRLKLTSNDYSDHRDQRLIAVCGFLRALLTAREYAAIYRLHDDKGSLTVGVRCSRHRIDSAKIEREVAAAWEAVNEYDWNVHYPPDWT